MLTLTREQVRRVDGLAIEELGIPGVVLMENAGRGAAAVILNLIRGELGLSPHQARVTILCGGGNNGGDGYVIARHLHNAGAAVTIDAAKAPDQLTGDAAVNARIAQRMGLTIRPITDQARLDTAATAWPEAHVIVDALLGTGFRGEVRAPLRQVIQRCNGIGDAASGILPLKDPAHGPRGHHRPRVVAIDIPSGLDCDAGGAGADAVVIRADLTITFVAPKTGFAVPEARAFLGRVEVVEIGVPPELVQRVAAGG